MNNLVIYARNLDSRGLYKQADAIDSALQQTNSTVYHVPVQNMQELTSKIIDLNTKISKINEKVPDANIDLIDIQVIGEEPWEYFSSALNRKVQGVKYLVKLTGATPIINGWEVVSTIQHAFDDDGQPSNFVFSSPNNNVDTMDYRRAQPVCEHCGQNRARNKTVVLRHNESKQLKQVGKTCLVDFLGHANPHYIITILEHLQELLERSGGSIISSDHQRIDTSEAAGILAFIIGKYGYSSRNDTIPTRYLLWCLYHNVGHDDKENGQFIKQAKADLQNLTDDELAAYMNKGKEALQWAVSLLDKDKPSDFEWNMGNAARQALSEGVVNPKTFGLFAYTLPGYEKHLGKLKEQERKPKEVIIKPSEDQIRAKYPVQSKIINTPATITYIDHRQGDYGYYTLLFLEDDDHIKMQCNTTTSVDGLEQGDKVMILRATIKNHYTSRPFTKNTGEVVPGELIVVITRAKFDSEKWHQSS